MSTRLLRRIGGVLALAGALAVLSQSAGAQSGNPVARADPARLAEGERIYREGMLRSGKPLVGEREAGVRAEGAGAACQNCHRRSGFGMAEGNIVIPPVTGTYLYRAHGRRIEDMDLRYVQGSELGREPYSDQTLARAIREGVGRSGRPLNYLMPRFALDDQAMGALSAYLKTLSVGNAPGVTDDTLHFATIITPDADPARRQGALDVLNRFFATKNEFIKGGARPMRPGTDIVFRVTRRWQLHVWELSGAADTWEKQLETRLASEPVFAVISGVGGRDWAPVHRFCQRAALPCVMPNVDLPVDAEGDYYPLYLSKGVLLDAQLIGHRIASGAAGSGTRPARVLQVYRRGDIGAAAAAQLGRLLAPGGVPAEDRVLPQSGAADLAEALRGTRPGDALVLWLRPEDLANLPAPPGVAQVFVSGTMGGLEHTPLPPAWRAGTLLAYPADLPDLRRFRMNFPLTWFKIKKIPLVAERTQVDTYMACTIMADMLNEMLDSFVRDYFMERYEMMLSRWNLSAYYPRLGLAAGQRFASRGGYLARFAGPAGTQLTPEGDWLTP